MTTAKSDDQNSQVSEFQEERDMEGSREQAERLKAELNGELRRVGITWDELLMAATGGPGDLPG